MSVVQSLLVEMDAQTAKLDAALAQSSSKVRDFKKTADDAGTAGTTLGNKYGSAAIQISSAAENMARMGKVTGEASKQVINQASQVAFAFGPTGMIVGAIGITTLAIAELFSRTKKEAKEAVRVAEEEFARLAKSGSLASTADRLSTVYNGNPFASSGMIADDPKLLGLAELRRRRQQADVFRAGGAESLASAALTEAQAKALRELETEYAKLLPLVGELAKKEAERSDLAMRLAGEQKDRAKAEAAASAEETMRANAAKDAIEQQSEAWKAGIAKQAEAIKARDEAQRESAEVTKRLSDQLAKELARQTTTLIDDIQQKYQQWIDEAIGAGNFALAKRFIEARDAAMELQRTIEDLDAAAKALGLDFKDIANAGVSGSGAAMDPVKFNLLADAIERSARGAIQLAEAFGLVDANTSKSLQAIAQVAASLPQLKRATSAGQWSGATGIIASAMPVVGGIATVVEAFLSAGKAAREHAKALREAAERFTESLNDRLSGFGLTDAQARSQGIAKELRDGINTMLDQLIQNKGIKVGTRDDFWKADDAGQRKILTDALADTKLPWLKEALKAAIEQFDKLVEISKKAKAEMEAEQAARRQSFDQSLEERRLRLKGDVDAADAAALLAQHEQELADRRKEGIYTAEQLAELERIQVEERKKAAEEAKKRREEEARQKAQATARRNEDLQTRINAADGETPEEAARRREIEKRRELEDAMADGADLVTINLIKLAHAAEDAAAAQAALTAAQRDMEDLDVRLLRARGESAKADEQELANRQRREIEDAERAGKDPAFVAKLRETLAAEWEAFKRGLEAGATAAAGGGDRNVYAGSETQVTSVGTAISEGSANRVVAELSTIRIHTKQAADELAMIRAMSGSLGGALVPPALGGAGAAAARPSVTINLNGPITALDGGRQLSQTLIREINRALGRLYLQANDLNGSAAVT